MRDSKTNSNIGNFGIYSKKVIEAVRSFREHYRSFGLFVLWSGFKRIEIPIEHAKRECGKSSYTLAKLLTLAFDSMLSHSNKPLKLSVQLGFFISFVSFIYALWLIIDYFVYSSIVQGWTSLIVSVFFLSGLIIGSIGMVGLYVDKIFDEVKNRPLHASSVSEVLLQQSYHL